ncbi:MAG: ABC transporter substrate-binding protein [Pseudomonadota bacterium]|nr:ABC transporter substrate-binding protein [Pseudomonadota bacterium]
MRAISLLALAAGALACAPALADQRTITVNTVQIFGTIDPAKISDYTDYMATTNLYDGLANIDAKGGLVPELAEKWDVSPDASSVIFHIRADAHFQDGSPVQAEDVVYSVERLLKINQGPANLFAGVLKPGSVAAIDPKTVKFTLSKTFSPFLATVPAIRIVNSKVVKANAGADDGQTYLATHVASAGAYTLKSWDRGTGMTIVRDPHYYRGWGPGAIDEVRFLITNDEATVRSLAASGELTMASQFQSPDTNDALSKMPRFKIVKDATATAFYLKLNSKVAPTNDVHIRKAIALATDYDTIRGTIFPGAELTGPLPKAFADANINAPAPKFDLEAAKAEIAKSGYAGKSDIPISLLYVSSAKFEEEVALLMQSNLQQIGFKVTLSGEPWNRVTELATKVETTPNINEIFFGPTYASPDSMFYAQYHSKSAGSWASMEWLQNPEVDKMIDAARATGDQDARNKIYKELQAKLIADQSDVFLETQTVRHAMDKCLDGFAYVPMQSFEYNFHKYTWTCK